METTKFSCVSHDQYIRAHCDHAHVCDILNVLAQTIRH